MLIFYHISAKGPINWDAFGIFFLQYLTRLRKTLSCLNIFRCRILVCLQYILHLVKYNVIKNAPIYFCLFCFFFSRWEQEICFLFTYLSVITNHSYIFTIPCGHPLIQNFTCSYHGTYKGGHFSKEIPLKWKSKWKQLQQSVEREQKKISGKSITVEPVCRWYMS